MYFPARLKTIIRASSLIFLLPLFAAAQSEESWPPLSYLRSDYKAVSVVAHVRIREAEISGRVGGYENWKVVCEVIESFKGRFRKGAVVEYFLGAEAGLRKEYFKGEKIVFLLVDHDAGKRKARYSVLENSTLPHTADRVRNLRMIKRADARRRSSRASERLRTIHKNTRRQHESHWCCLV
jgi:hypothetical protein